MPKLKINDQDVEVPAGFTVLQACQEAGVEVPVFCYHDRLKIAGNCRMCLVELKKAPKPIASCAFQAADGMEVYTNSPMAQKARKGTLEFLLINHPLDCPICDQGGECDLQDETMVYGFDRGRFQENKRAVPEKYMGPLVKTEMTRCIHCTRCVRFITDVAGVEELGAVGRGEGMEISTYVEKSLSSELSGNIIDLCPVGALTSKPYAFKARSWELTKTESIDIFDAVGSNIRVDSFGQEVLRILPRLHEDVNEEWLADKARFAYDGLLNQRLDQPYIRKDGKLTPASWEEALGVVAAKLKGTSSKKIAAIAGDMVDVESMVVLKDIMEGLGSPNHDCRQDGSTFDFRHRASYLFNTTIAGIESADLCLFVGTNPRWEAPLVNARLRKRALRGEFLAANIGAPQAWTFDIQELGDSPTLLEDILKGTHPFAEKLKAAKSPMIILGAAALARGDGQHLLKAAHDLSQKYALIREDWNGFNVLQTAASRVGGLDIRFIPGPNGIATPEILQGCEDGSIEVLYLLGADELPAKALKKPFVIYQGHHGDLGAHEADVILPGAAFTEKSGTYVNIEGRVQRTAQAIFPPNLAREDWKILRALSDYLDQNLPYDTLDGVRSRMVEKNKLFYDLDIITPAEWTSFGEEGKITTMPFTYPISNYYRTDPISRASATMAKCTRDILHGTTENLKEAAHG